MRRTSRHEGWMPGPQPKTTREQRKRVLELVDAGRSYSAVAAEAFGDERYRGRVERIVRSHTARDVLSCLQSLSC